MSVTDVTVIIESKKVAELALCLGGKLVENGCSLDSMTMGLMSAALSDAVARFGPQPAAEWLRRLADDVQSMAETAPQKAANHSAHIVAAI